jgi:hypothetical protein
MSSLQEEGFRARLSRVRSRRAVSLPHSRPESAVNATPGPRRGPLVTLLVFAAAASLFFLFLDDALHLTHSRALLSIWHVLPAVGGAAVLSYLDSLRAWCLRVCANRLVQFASVLSLALALGITVISVPVPLTVTPGARIFVDSIFKPAKSRTSNQLIWLRGLAFHRVEIVEKTAKEEFADTVEVGPLDIVRLWWNRGVHHGSSLDPYRLVTTRQFSVDAGGVAKFVYVAAPDFPKFYLRNIKRDAQVEHDGNFTTVSFQLYPREGKSEFMRVPAGEYRVWLDRSPCRDSRGDTLVATVGAEPTLINFTGCRPNVSSGQPIAPSAAVR